MKPLLRWLPVGILALVAVVAAPLAVVRSNDRVPPVATATVPDAPTTPLLSARRVPTLIAAPTADRRLEAALTEFIAGQGATTCLVVNDDETTLFDHRGREPMIPASTQKLLTAAAVLLELGPDTAFETVAVGPPLPPGGVLAGDLVLVGGGDPILATDRYVGSLARQPQIHTDFEVLADRLVEAGLTEVTGSVVGDEGRYDTRRGLPIPEVWLPEDLVADVTGPLSALHVNDGFVAFPGDGLGTTTFVESLDPAAHAAGLLTDELRFRGVLVAGEPRSGTAPGGVQALAAVQSAPLTAAVAEMLQESDNSTAELLLKELGRATGRGGTSVGGTEALTAVLAAAGFDVEGTRPLDGSGVANGNLTTCKLMAEILTDDRVDDDIVDGLSVAGVNGTLADRFVGTELEGTLRGKTGSLRVVTALAGEVETAGEADLQFAYLLNVAAGGVVSGELFAATEQLALVMHRYPELPDSAAIGPR